MAEVNLKELLALLTAQDESSIKGLISYHQEQIKLLKEDLSNCKNVGQKIRGLIQDATLVELTLDITGDSELTVAEKRQLLLAVNKYAPGKRPAPKKTEAQVDEPEEERFTEEQQAPTPDDDNDLPGLD